MFKKYEIQYIIKIRNKYLESFEISKYPIYILTNDKNSAFKTKDLNTIQYIQKIITLFQLFDKEKVEVSIIINE